MQRIDLFFNEEEHKYTDQFGNVYTSATTKLKEFETPFDKPYNLRRCAEKGRSGQGRYVGMSEKQIDQFWKDTTNGSLARGNETHNELEANVKIANGYYKSSRSLVKEDNKKIKLLTVDDIMDNHDFGELNKDAFLNTVIANKYPDLTKLIIKYCDEGYRMYPELGVYYFEALLSGLIDLPLINFKTKSIIIIDYKTNKHPMLFTSGYYKKNMDGSYTDEFIRTTKRFKAPLAHMEECLGNKYSLQVSYYARLLELKLGFKVKELKIFQIKPKTNEFRDVIEPVETTTHWYDIAYYKREIDKVIDLHKVSIKNKIKLQLGMDFTPTINRLSIDDIKDLLI